MRKAVLLIPLFALLCLPTFANVFPAQLDPEPGDAGSWNFNTDGKMDIQYRLNEAATDVTVELYVASAPGVVVKTIDSASPVGTLAGLNTLQWDGSQDGGGAAASGTYSFRVIAADSVGHAVAAQISLDGATTSKYYSPKGVACNTDPTSPYFGLVYVTEGLGGSTGGRTTTDGVFIMNADLSPYDSQGDVGHDGGIDWLTSSYSPARVTLDAGGNLIIADWSDTNSGVWMAPPDVVSVTPFVEVLDNTGRDGGGLCGNHGSIFGAYATGTGASRVIYTIDEDYAVDATAERWGAGLEYAVGNTVAYAAAPVQVVDNSPEILIVNSRAQIVPDTAGYWEAQYRWSDNVLAPMVQHWDIGTATFDFNSAAAGLAITRGYGALEINADETRLVLGEYSGFVALLDISGGAASCTTIVEISITGSVNNDVAFDAAGNFCSVNSSSERLRFWSPGDGPNSASTDYYGSFATISGLRVRDWVLY